MIETRTVKCICGRMYKTYMFYCGDQSACPTCRAEAEKACPKEYTPYPVFTEEKQP